MNKVALKSALIALISTIGALCLAIAVVSLVSPETLAHICDEAGLKRASVYYYKADYERDSDFYKLADLIDSADYADDDETLAYYGEKFVKSQEFKSYCEEKDGTNPSFKISSYNYYCYNVVRALYTRKNYKSSAKLAFSMTEKYEKDCPVSVAVMLALNENSRSYATEIISLYEENKNKISDVNGTLKADIDKLKEKYKEVIS